MNCFVCYIMAWFSFSLTEKGHSVWGCVIYSPQPVTQHSQKETWEREIVLWRQSVIFPELKFLVKLKLGDRFS